MLSKSRRLRSCQLDRERNFVESPICYRCCCASVVISGAFDIERSEHAHIIVSDSVIAGDSVLLASRGPSSGLAVLCHVSTNQVTCRQAFRDSDNSVYWRRSRHGSQSRLHRLFRPLEAADDFQSTRPVQIPAFSCPGYKWHCISSPPVSPRHIVLS